MSRQQRHLLGTLLLPSLSEGRPPAVIFVPRDSTPDQGDWSRADHLIHTSQSELFPKNVAQIEILKMMLTAWVWVAVLPGNGGPHKRKKEAEPQAGSH